MNEPITVKEFIERLKAFPENWRVVVKTPAGGRIAIEHREVNGEPVVGVYGDNGGRFGENPLTEGEYEKKSEEFLLRLKSQQWEYTRVHGDHRLYLPGGVNATCFGTHYDSRIIERMISEGLLDPLRYGGLVYHDAY